MEIVWKNLKVSEFYKICRLCLANKELEPLADEEKSTLVKLTPWIAQLETSVFFPNKICAECAKQLHQANEFLNRCNTLSNSFHKCLEDYKESVKEDSSLPSLEALLFPPKLTIKQEHVDHEIEQEPATMPFTEVFLAGDIKKEELMEFEDTKFIPQQTTSNFVESTSQFDNAEAIESTPDIPVTTKFGAEAGERPTQKKASRRSGIVRLPPPEVAKLKAVHLPKAINIKNAPRCRNPGCNKRSRIKCTSCDIFFCVVRDRDCFVQFHS